MGHSRRQLRPAFVLALLFACPVASACGAAPSSEVSPAATAPRASVSPATATGTAGDRLVLFARPRLITAARLDGAGAPAVAGLEVRSHTSGEDILIDLEAGRHADVVEVCSNESAERMAREGLLRPLDTSRIAQWEHLYPALKKLPGVVVDGRVYMVPVTAAATGIIYDPRAAGSPPDSFADLFARRYKGHLAFADDPALAFQVAALDLGLHDPVALTAEEALDAEIYLKHYEDNYRSFWYDLDNLASAFRGGRVTVAVGDRHDALQLAQRGAPVAFALAAEGQPLAACGLAITASSGDPGAAYALIDHLLEPATQAHLALSGGELVANRNAADLVSSAERARLGLSDLAHLERPVARVPSLEHLDWIQAWYEVKKGRG